MSEATLKKKTRTQYRNMSVGSKNGGFSLNGTRRSQGYVGQTMLGRHFPRTPMRGNEARGSGGCFGKYYRGTIIQSGIPFPSGVNGNSANNDPKVVKPSVINNNGLIMTKYRWIRRPQPYSTFKENVLDANKNVVSKANTISQGVYIKNKSTNLIEKLSANPIKIINELTYTDGLIYTVYDDYFNENVNFFHNNTTYKTGGTGFYTGINSNISSINAGTNGYVPDYLTNEFIHSVQWLGYFKPDVTGTWTFWTNSDDGSYLWVGSTATSGYTTSNCLVNNGGYHAMKEMSGTINLTAGIYYPIRIQYGNSGFNYNMIVSFQGPVGSKTTNGTGFFYNTDNTDNNISLCKSCRGNRPFGSVIRYPRAWVSITKMAGKIAGSNKLGPISQFEFISALTGKCMLNTKNIVKINRSPLPGPAVSY